MAFSRFSRRCLGDCANAPTVMVNEDSYGPVDPSSVRIWSGSAGERVQKTPEPGKRLHRRRRKGEPCLVLPVSENGVSGRRWPWIRSGSGCWKSAGRSDGITS